MTTPAPANPNKAAVAAVKQRFYRVPSSNTYPKFRDMHTGIEQADPYILTHYYYISGGSQDDLNANYLLNSLDVVYGEGFQPNGPVILDGGNLNLWKPSRIKPSGNTVSANDVQPFVEFMTRWFPDKEERVYFTWWLAHSIRKPETRIIATPVLRSEHGVGKGFLVETLLSELVGKTSVAVTSLKDVVGEFNDILESKTLILIDEVYKSKKSTTDALKSFQGNQNIRLSRKFRPTVNIENHINFIVTSNDHLPLALEKGDRRFWIPEFIKHKESVSETAKFINDELKPWLQSGGFQLVRDYLEQVNLSKFRATDAPPMTEAKSGLMGFTTTDKLEELLSDLVETQKVLTVKWIKEHYREDFDYNLSDMAIANALLSIGCKQRRTKTCRYYITEQGFASGLSMNTTAKELEANMPDGSF